MKNILTTRSVLNLQRAALWTVVGLACFSSVLTMAQSGVDMGCSPTVANPCTVPSGNPSSGGGGYRAPTRDYEAERRQQEAAAAEAAAETERQRLAEDHRLKVKAEKDAAFIRERDSAACKLKGAICPNGSPQNGGLKGSGDYGLKDAVSDSGLRGSTTANPDQSRQTLAWKQLRCASSIAAYALRALQDKGDYNEFGALSTEALKALDGGRPNVECPPDQPMPDLNGGMAGMERRQAKEKQILERAGKIADRMKQAEARKPGAQSSSPAPAPAPAGETEIEKLRRVQRELNQKNSRPIKNQQDENNRKELTQLILENEKLTSVTNDLGDDAPRKPRVHHPPPPPANP